MYKEGGILGGKEQASREHERNPMINAHDPLIELEGLRKIYRRGWWGKSLDALQAVSFQVRRGEVFGLLGPNGAGKTTIIKILLGIIRASAGKARLLGYPAGDRRSRQRVGYLPENLQLPPHQTAETALEYYGRLSGLSHSTIHQRRDRLIETVGLTGRSRESVKRFSKGMRQRLGLAQALLHDPELIVLDEPTDGLDPVGRSQVRNILQQVRDEGRTVFLNSHLLQEVELICDRVAILDRGQLKFVGRIDELTPPQQNELQLQVRGEQSTIQTALARWAPEFTYSAGADLHSLRVPVRDQADADQMVDALRDAACSLVSLTWRRKTLEDAFLELVGNSPIIP